MDGEAEGWTRGSLNASGEQEAGEKFSGLS